ncbi:deoxyribose-phosphate aldolase [Phaeodactylibacter luteus]|uniref:Deoxyribose-phosphate aldolase n=1 Tax=Phaeodactylibacter luteus TaxID=1564516 RepID=A0A5C6RHT1_9BACT|nr:deoxyribose-phosphate aldolase [Phaeodactylibacter luteus]TXB62008.1 deoxyribose-phosphate aldolase [Phaeodactylibacter luteus]
MNLNSYIDHTLLRPDCTTDDIEQLCTEAKEHQFAAVCVPPFFVKLAAELLEDSPVRIATVVGFPMGYASTPAKIEEIKRAIDEGADEIDAVLNICALKAGNINYLTNDIDSMITATHLKGKQIKIILETGLLTMEEVEQAAQICLDKEADFLKTSTGFNGGGATLEMVSFLGRLAGGKAKVKASGGIRTREDALGFIEAGAQRLGTSSGLKLIGAV